MTIRLYQDKSEMPLWVEKYRPSTVAECILPKRLADMFGQMVKQRQVPNMLLSGKSGIGKTTVALAMCAELDFDALLIDGSLSGNIDTLRTTVQKFASTQSMTGHKVVIIDEADYLTAAAQPALRCFMEEYAKNTSFIFTCNLPNKIIQPLHSRCVVIPFEIPKEEKVGLLTRITARVTGILKAEDVQCDEAALTEIVFRYFPDMRRMLNELQGASYSGHIDAKALVSVTDDEIKLLFKALKAKDFTKMRQWVANHNDIDANMLIQRIFNALHLFTPRSQPDAVLVLGDAQYRAAFVASQEINLVAALSELMARCDFIES